MNLDERLALLKEAAEVAEELGIENDGALRALDVAEKRLGFTGEVYVIALVGGTGVGKSSILNSLAGDSISSASVLRPTTQQPVAYVAGSSLAEAEPLLQWLEADRIVTHSDQSLASVALLDFPDFDSIATAHRAQVDRLLPRVDVVIWVVDPEKYDDERLFGYLRQLGPRVPDVRVLLNKVDHLSERDQAQITDDLTSRLARLSLRYEVTPISAATGAGIPELRTRIRNEADAKREIADRIEAEATAALLEMASAAAIDPGGRSEPLISEREIAESANRATVAALAIVDPGQLVAQVRNSHLERSKARAGSLIGRVASLFRLTVGHRRRHADPAVFLRSWRSRGDIGRAVNPVRSAYLAATARLGPQARARLLTGFDADTSRAALTSAVDRAVKATSHRLAAPSTWLVSIITPFQWIATAGFIAGLVWVALLVFGPGGTPVGEVDLPYLGPTPAPLVVLFGSAIVSVLLGLLARLHASWVGRRRGLDMERALREEVGKAVREEAFLNLDDLERRRERLAEIVELYAVD